MVSQGNGYPARLEVDYPDSPSRVLALLGALFFIKALLLIPHYIVLTFLGIANLVCIYISYWAVLITGRYPGGLFAFVLGVQRWSYRTSAWSAGFTDRYPPFTLSRTGDYALKYEVDYPESSSRGLALLGVLFFIKALLLIPHQVILYSLGAASLTCIYISYWAVLITGSYPRGLFAFSVGVMRWSIRTDAWFLGFADRYPPFGLD